MASIYDVGATSDLKDMGVEGIWAISGDNNRWRYLIFQFEGSTAGWQLEHCCWWIQPR